MVPATLSLYEQYPQLAGLSLNNCPFARGQLVFDLCVRLFVVKGNRGGGGGYEMLR